MPDIAGSTLPIKRIYAEIWLLKPHLNLPLSKLNHSLIILNHCCCIFKPLSQVSRCFCLEKAPSLVPIFCLVKQFSSVAVRLSTSVLLSASQPAMHWLRPPSLPPSHCLFLRALLPLLLLTSLPSLWSLLVHNSSHCPEHKTLGQIVFTNTFQGLF